MHRSGESRLLDALLEQGLIEERKLFLELTGGEQSQAQRYFFFAERKAAKIEGLPETVRPREIHKVGVVGAGTMGGGISMNFLSAGIPVRIVEMTRDALDRGTAMVSSKIMRERGQGKIDQRSRRKGHVASFPCARNRSAFRLRSHHRGGLRKSGGED